MADYTITRNLKLRIADDLSADAKYNLDKIDALGGNLSSTFTSGAGDLLNIFSRGNIQLLAAAASIGGSGNGTITLGDTNSTVLINSVALLKAALNLSSGNSTAISLLAAQNNTNSTVTLSATGSQAINISESGTVVVKDGSNNFSAGTITANLLGNATNITASSNSTLTTLSSLSLPGTQVGGDILGNAANVNGIVALTNGGTGNNGSNKATALLDLLPATAGKALSVLRINVTENGIEWATGAGAGTVTNVAASAPLVVGGDPQVSPTISLPAATSSVDGYLTAANWTTFNTVTTKEPAITGSGNAAQFWNGNKAFATVTKSDVGLSNIDNTSDANKPISSATQTALNAKYDASNPALYVDAAGARGAAVVNSTAGSEIDQAASVFAMKSYVASQGGGSVSYTWSTADGATKSITHSLDKATISVTIYDENGEDILVDVVDRTSNNAVSLTSSVAPTGNWTVVIRP
jgi:hypothetical protein